MDDSTTRELSEEGLRQILEQTLLLIFTASAEEGTNEVSVEEVVDQLAERLWNSPAPSREDAAISLCKTLLRRKQEGEIKEYAQEELPEILLDLAKQKIRKQYWGGHKEFTTQLDDLADAKQDAQAEEEVRRQQEKKLEVAKTTLASLRKAMKNPLHRSIWHRFQQWIEKGKTRTEQPTQSEIALQCKCSERTVRGVWRRIEQLFERAAETARRTVHES